MKEKLLDGLNKISEILVLFDASDLSSLGQAYQEFVILSNIAEKHGDTGITAALSDMANMTEAMVMDENYDHQKAIGFLSQAIAAISEALREGKKYVAGETATPSYSTEPAVVTMAVGIADGGGGGIAQTYAKELCSAVEKESEIAQDFALEAKDHLENCSESLLELDKNPDDADNINSVFRCFHSIKGVAGFLNLKIMQNIAHKAEDILDSVRSGKMQYEKKVANLIFETTDALRFMVDDISAILSGKDPADLKTDIRDLERRLAAVLSKEENFLDFPEDAEVKYQPIENVHPSEPPGGSKSGHREVTGKKEVIKVDADRLNRLIDTIGELVIAETIVLESEETRNNINPQYLRKISQLDKITRELQTMGMSLRMVAVKSTFQHMARLVRDLSEKEGKKVDFSICGEDTEIDKNIVDKIGDPLVHMIRNAIDHGIEKTPEDRVNAGKDAVAQVEIRAFHRGGNICIEIEDDGRGIDPDMILKKAIEKGLVAAENNLTRNEIVNLIFMPGFSTAEKITDVSGRGVGMDVVKRNITDLNGTVDVFSEPGQGSTFSIKLPLTLAIIDGMVVRVAEEKFIIPTLSITRAVNITPEQMHRVKGKEFVLHQDRNIQLFRLGRFLQLDESVNAGDNSLMLILEDGENISGILIDELVGKQQIVIKSLGETFQNIEGYSGCAILSDGSVGLIIDVNSLIKNYYH